jgi:tetratricopeptide (TPR) repeat protein
VSLPALTLAIVRRWPGSAEIAKGLEPGYREGVLALPPELPEAERADVVEMLALFLDLPVHVAAHVADAPRDHLIVLTEPVDAEPPRVAGSLVLCALRRAPGHRHLEVPQDLRILRDAIVDCIGVRYVDARLRRAAAWAGSVSDSPGLALRSASASIARHLAAPDAPDAEILAAGLAAAVGFLLRGVDVRVAQWVLARALPAKHPERLVDTDAAILGEKEALKRAFAAGLVENLPEEPLDPLDLRVPLQWLGEARRLPRDMTLDLVAKELRAVLAPAAHVVVSRFLASAPKPLGLSGPARPPDFVGRGEILKRLRSLFEPADMVRTAVLYGIDGSGRTAVAAALGELLGATQEPVWITFAGGAVAGWVPVANALRVDLVELQRDAEESRVPIWVKHVHALIKDRACMLVVSDVDDIPERELPEWLPSGPGECGVLVLSRSAQRALRWEHDAIAVPLRGLSVEESRELLAGKAPKWVDEISRGEADGLLRIIDGHPVALGMAAALLETKSMPEVEALARHRDGPIRVLVEHALAALDNEQTKLVRALAVCAPEGSPPNLPLGIANVGVAPLERLLDLALVVTRKGRVRLHGLVRFAIERESAGEERAKLEMTHAEKTAKLLMAAQSARRVQDEDDVYEDAFVGLERMTGRCQPGTEGVAAVAALVEKLAWALWKYPRWDHAERIRRVIAGYNAALAVVGKEEAPERWSDLQHDLGLAFAAQPSGTRAQNLRDAIDAFRAALSVRTRDAYPHKWAATQSELGLVLSELPVGEKPENLRQAIDAFRGALEVQARGTLEWGRTQIHLGRALTKLTTGDKAKNLRQAIEAHRAALTACTRDASPYDWAKAQNNLGNALMRLPTGDKGANLRDAIAAYHAALTFWTKETYPRDWATTHNNLGTALADLPIGDKAENIREAIGAYRAALIVLTKDRFPWQWAQTQRNLGLSLRELASCDRKQNLRDAIDAFRNALTVYTPEAFPVERVQAQANLAAALRDLAALEAPLPEP